MKNEDFGEAWDLLCALAEFILVLYGVDQKIAAFQKFAEALGKVGVKGLSTTNSIDCVEPRPKPAPTSTEGPRTLNLQAFLDALGIEAFRIPKARLVTLLSQSKLRRAERVITILEPGQTVSVASWLKTGPALRLLEQAVLTAAVVPDGYMLELDFGGVKPDSYPTSPKLTARSTTALGRSVMGEYSPRGATDLAAVSIRLQYVDDLSPMLEECGVQLADTTATPGFVLDVSQPDLRALKALLICKP